MGTDSRAPRWLWKAVKIAISTGLVIFLISRLDFVALTLARRVSAHALVASLALFVLAQLWGSWRLWILLRAQGVAIGLREATRLTFLGLFLSNFSLGTVGGDVGKAVVMSQGRIPTRLSMLTVFVDRVAGFTAALSLTAVAVLATNSGGFVFSSLVGSPKKAAVWGLSALLLLIVAIAVLLFWRRRERASGGLLPSLAGSATVLRRWLSPATAVPIATASVLAFASSVGGQFVLLRELGLETGLLTLAGVVGIVYLITLVPVSLNGLGVQEVSFVYLLTATGAAEQPAMVLALLTRLFMVATSLPGAAGLVVSNRV